MANGDFYYGVNGERIPLRRSTRSLAIAYLEAVPPKDVEALVRGDDRLAQFIVSPELSSRRMVLYRRSEQAAGSLESFAERVRASGAIEYLAGVFYRGENPVIVTREFIAAFKPGVSRREIDALNDVNGVELLEEVGVSPNGYLLGVRQPTGLADTLEMANRYYETGLLRYAEPNFIESLGPLAFTPNDPLFSQQWHLPRIQAEDAWDITRGNAGVIIAVIDEGIDIDHEDIAAPGKIVAPLDAHDGDNDPRPAAVGEAHGTAVSGVATANGNNGIGVTGSAPDCSLIPIRLIGPSFTNLRASQAIQHAVDNGADVINNSWGPQPPAAPFPLAAVIGDAFDYALANGRGGLGTVVMFAAANRNASISDPATLNGLATDDRVIAVAAVNDVNVRSGYSDFGATVDICAPSGGSDSGNLVPPFPADGSTLNIFTTDQMGAGGYNNSIPPLPADPVGAALNYTGTFSGTSSACPLAAGVVALMVSVAPDLTRDQLKFVLEATADKVDFTNTDPVGQYQPNGHSQWYGFGRVNAFEAVKSARSSVEERDFVQSVQVTLRRTSGDRFVATKEIQTIDARRRQDETATEIFVRGGPDGFLRAEMAGAFDEAEVDA